MPTYYFHQQEGTGLIEDPEGSDLPDLPAAYECAVQSARELLANAVRFNTAVVDRIFVVDEEGNELLTISITEVLQATLQKKFR
jgi:hypothetical protein